MSVRSGSFLRTETTGTPYKYAARPAPLSPPGIASRHSRCPLGRTSVRLFPFLQFRARHSSSDSHTFHQPHQVRGQAVELRACHGAFRMNHDVPPLRNFLPVAPHDPSNSPPDAIAYDRSAQGLLDAEAEAAHRQMIGAKENCEVGTGSALSGAVKDRKS